MYLHLLWLTEAVMSFGGEKRFEFLVTGPTDELVEQHVSSALRSWSGASVRTRCVSDRIRFNESQTQACHSIVTAGHSAAGRRAADCASSWQQRREHCRSGFLAEITQKAQNMQVDIKIVMGKPGSLSLLPSLSS